MFTMYSLTVLKCTVVANTFIASIKNVIIRGTYYTPYIRIILTPCFPWRSAQNGVPWNKQLSFCVMIDITGVSRSKFCMATHRQSTAFSLTDVIIFVGSDMWRHKDCKGSKNWIYTLKKSLKILTIIIWALYFAVWKIKHATTYFS